MATKCVTGAGYRATCIDLMDSESAGFTTGYDTVFDINPNSGMVFLNYMVSMSLFHPYYVSTISCNPHRTTTLKQKFTIWGSQSKPYYKGTQMASWYGLGFSAVRGQLFPGEVLLDGSWIHWALKSGHALLLAILWLPGAFGQKLMKTLKNII